MLTLTPAQITAAVAEDGTRGLLPIIVKRAANLQLPDIYVDVMETPAFVAKLQNDEEYTVAKIKNAASGAIKNAQKNAILAGNGASFPELQAVVVTDDDNVEHVLVVNQRNLVSASTNGNGATPDADDEPTV